MSDVKDIVTSLFPYPQARPGQIELICEGIAALEGGARHLLIDAPTGTGKTPIAIAIALYFTRKYPLEIGGARSEYVRVAGGRKVSKVVKNEALAQLQTTLGPHQAHMITSLKMLQAQYLDANTRHLITLMMGKNNYKCRSLRVADGTSCGEFETLYGDGHTCKLGRDDVCAYQDAKFAAQCARATLHNFDSFLAQASLGGSFLPRAVLTIDEAHGAEAKVIDAVAFTLSQGQMMDLGAAWDLPNVRDDAEVSRWLAAKALAVGVAKARMTLEVEALKNSGTLLSKADFRRMRELANLSRECDEAVRKVDRYVATKDKPWVVEIDATGGSVRFEPVKGSYFAKSALLAFGTKTVLLSATILDRGHRVMSGLNLKQDETVYLAAKNTFPVSSRRIIETHAAVDTGQSKYAANKARMCAEIERVLALHPGVRGVVHANSYAMAQDIANGVQSPRILSHGHKDRAKVVAGFLSPNTPKDAVLVGVFVKEGFDFKDDLCRFQIVPRLPYPYVSKRIEARKELEPGYYDWLTCVDLMQECGRGTRSATDSCTTYVIDARFGAFVRRAMSILPRWFTEAIELERRP